MKRIVDDLLYDTEESTLIYCDMVAKRNYYQTKNNHFFCFYVSGDIVPIAEEAMKDILGKNDVEKYIEIFGEPKEA